jgi:hypothetical protein
MKRLQAFGDDRINTLLGILKKNYPKQPAVLLQSTARRQAAADGALSLMAAAYYANEKDEYRQLYDFVAGRIQGAKTDEIEKQIWELGLAGMAHISVNRGLGTNGKLYQSRLAAQQRDKRQGEAGIPVVGQLGRALEVAEVTVLAPPDQREAAATTARAATDELFYTTDRDRSYDLALAVAVAARGFVVSGPEGIQLFAKVQDILANEGKLEPKNQRGYEVSDPVAQALLMVAAGEMGKGTGREDRLAEAWAKAQGSKEPFELYTGALVTALVAPQQSKTILSGLKPPTGGTVQPGVITPPVNGFYDFLVAYLQNQ